MNIYSIYKPTKSKYSMIKKKIHANYYYRIRLSSWNAQHQLTHTSWPTNRGKSATVPFSNSNDLYICI